MLSGRKDKLLNALSRRYHLARLNTRLKQQLSIESLQITQPSRNEQYLYCVHFYDRYLPCKLKEHRRYFLENGRGFGEDAFHAMWFLIFQQFRPRQVLEIGVYRGQIITLWKLLSQHFGFPCEVSCVSPFAPVGYHTYPRELDYLKDVEVNHAHFGISMPAVCRQLSTSPEAKEFINQTKWDLIYIDGNHDYEIVREDWATCSASVKVSGLIVLDDAALGTDYRPPRFASAGFSGPSQVAQEVGSAGFKEIFAVGHNRVFERLQ